MLVLDAVNMCMTCVDCIEATKGVLVFDAVLDDVGVRDGVPVPEVEAVGEEVGVEVLVDVSELV